MSQQEQTGYYDEATETYYCNCGWTDDIEALDALAAKGDGGLCPQCGNKVFED